MTFIKTTEADSHYANLENMDTATLLRSINTEDKNVAIAVEKTLPVIEKFVDHTVEKMAKGGRLFYIGAGTSGRLGILDASECPPTFGVSPDKIIGLIAGGDDAIRKAVENAEDNEIQAFLDLKKHNINTNDTVIGIAASGTTPYVIGGLKACNENSITTAAITCNMDSPLDQIAQFSIVPVVGPEFVTGSSRMKAGTAQKMILNMISTSIMIKLGHVKGNKMIDMQLSNSKLIDRGTRMIIQETGVTYEKAYELLLHFGNAREAINYISTC